MIRYLLTIFGMILLLYALREWRRSRLISILLVSVSAAGLVFVWMPSFATGLAGLMGVGRPADLVLYSYSAMSFILILNLALTQREQHRDITRLARHIAINSASRPPPPLLDTEHGNE